MYLMVTRMHLSAQPRCQVCTPSRSYLVSGQRCRLRPSVCTAPQVHSITAGLVTTTCLSCENLTLPEP